MTGKRFAAIALLGGMAMTLAAAPLLAQPYPKKPVRIITAGAGNFHDTLTRLVARELTERWGQPIVVENRPGAGLTIAAGIAARSTPDGYTLLMGDKTCLASAPWLFKKLSYDPVTDLAPITLVATMPLILVAHPSIPASNMKEFVDYVKGRPSAFLYGVSFSGTAGHIAGELFKHFAGVNMTAVNYKGGNAVSTAVVAGEVKAGFTTLTTALPHIAVGKLKGYAITSRERFVGAPQIPTMEEAGLPRFDSQQWLGVLAPAGTQAALVDRLNRDFTDVIRMPAIRKAFNANGTNPAAGSPADFAAFMREEAVKVRKAIELSGIKPR